MTTDNHQSVLIRTSFNAPGHMTSKSQTTVKVITFSFARRSENVPWPKWLERSHVANSALLSQVDEKRDV
jgi:hypothetical protein